VAWIAQAEEVSANQVFACRREFTGGELVERAARPTALLPVTIAAPSECVLPGAPKKGPEQLAPSP
jgi:hypothetical protein